MAWQLAGAAAHRAVPPLGRRRLRPGAGQRPGLGAIEANGTNIRAAGFKLALAPRQRQFLDRVVAEISREPVNTPHVGDLAKLLAVPHQAVD